MYRAKSQIVEPYFIIIWKKSMAIWPIPVSALYWNESIVFVMPYPPTCRFHSTLLIAIAGGTHDSKTYYQRNHSVIHGIHWKNSQKKCNILFNRRFHSYSLWIERRNH